MGISDLQFDTKAGKWTAGRLGQQITGFCVCLNVVNVNVFTNDLVSKQ